jgi:hypothetical protein
MQPTNEQPQQSPYAGASGSSYPTSAPLTTVKSGRPWLVAIVAYVTLLVLIAAVGNQWITDAIDRHALHVRSFADNAARAATTYQWRFSPRGGKDVDHVWLANIALVVVALVLTFLLVAIVCRGKGGFGQVFVGSWLVVVVATLLATYVRTAVIDQQYFGNSGLSKANSVVFAYSAGPSTLAAGLGVGFIVAVGAPAQGAEWADGPAREPWSAPPTTVPGPIASPSPWADGAEQPASGRDRGSAERAQHTSVLPVVDGPAHDEESASESSEPPRGEYGATTQSDGEQTTELPRAEPDPGPESPRHGSDDPQG